MSLISREHAGTLRSQAQIKQAGQRSLNIVLCTFFILVVQVSILSQNTVTGAFQGTVTDNRTNNPVTAAVVTVTNTAMGVAFTQVTDAKGRWWVGDLLPGTYQITITAPNFKSVVITLPLNITKTGEVIPVPVSLFEADPAQPAAPPTVLSSDNIRIEINTVDARRDGALTGDQLTVLPVGSGTVTRSFDEFALLLPGVAPPPQTVGDVAGPGVGPGVGSAGQFSVNGMRSRANNFTVDGSDNNDEDIGVRRQGFVSLISQSIESVQEFQLITLLAPPRFGRNIGGQVNAVSRTGGNLIHGNVYGFFNSSQLNARNHFDTTNGNAVTPVRSAAGQVATLDNQPISTVNQSGGEDSFTFAQAGATLGGAVRPNKTFYFLSAEYQRINAVHEKSFAVPTIEQRGPFRTGTTGITTNFFTGQPVGPLFPTENRGTAIFSLFPFPNDTAGIFGDNTFTQTLPADGRGALLSARLDHHLRALGRQHVASARYNFTDDRRDIASVNEAIFSSIEAKTRTQNLSLFVNSSPATEHSTGGIFNQLRFSFGRTHLNFDEIRDKQFLIPSDDLPNSPFMLNTMTRFNVTLPSANGQPRYARVSPNLTNGSPETVEHILGPIGQVNIAGFSPLGVDVYNFPQDRVNKTYQLADELTWSIGNHRIVFGTDLRRTDLDSNLPRLARTLITFNGSPRLVPGTNCANGGISNFCFLAQTDPRAIIRPEDLAGLGAASNSLLTLNVDRPGSRVDLRYYQINFFGQDTWRAGKQASLTFGLRYEYNTPVRERNRLIEQTFSDPRLATVPVLRDLVAGRTTLYNDDRGNFAPRVGLAYAQNLFSKKYVTVFRAGYGLFYDQVLGAVANQSRNVFPTFLTVNFGGVRLGGTPFLSIFNPASIRFAGIPLRQQGTVNSLSLSAYQQVGLSFADVIEGVVDSFPNSINVTLPQQDLKMPMAHHYSVTVEQQLSRHFTVSGAYVGTNGRHLLRFNTPNLGPSLTIVPTSIETDVGSSPHTRGVVYSPPRPLDRTDAAGNFFSLGAIDQFETTASSDYHSLQTQLRGRFLDRFDAEMAYTWSHVNDDVSDVFDLAGAYALPQDSRSLAAERGPANFDVRHQLAYYLNYRFKQGDRKRFISDLTRDLQISTTGRFHSGQPFTVNSVIDVNLDGNLTDRLNTLQGLEITGDRSQPLRLTTTNTTTLLAPFGKNGSIGRNSFRAGGVLELDLSVLKSFSLGSDRLVVRTDIFNFTNRTNYGVPIRLLEAAGFGKATTTVTPARRVQFSLKYEFGK